MDTRVGGPLWSRLFAVVVLTGLFVPFRQMDRFLPQSFFSVDERSHQVGIASEARMHAAGYRTTTLVLIATMAVTLGCRGSRPFGRYVQVTKGTDAELPEIPAPEQRLTTAKPRTPNDSRQAFTAELSDRTPQVTRTASQKTPSKSEATEARQASLKQTKKPESTNAAPNPANEKIAKTDSDEKKESPLAGVDPAQLMEAFKDYPPEVQREAMRRLMAATSRSADRTTQPNDPEKQLAKSMQNLPTLPEAKNKTPETPPTRIGTGDTGDDAEETTAAVASISDQPSKDESVKGGEAESDNLVVTEVESATGKSEPAEKPGPEQTAENKVKADGSVKPVSASQADGQESMIARAAGPAVDPAAQLNDEQSNAGMDLSQDALFAKLLAQLATAPEGESEAEKNSRLIRLRHLMVLSGDPDAAVEKIEGMTESEQEFLRHQLLGLWTMIDPQGHPVPSRRFTTAVPQIREAAKFAAAATDSLEVRSLAFCTEIESYGQIKTFPGNRFDSGQQVILYCEIENFSVKQMEDGFETHLQGSYDIYNSENEKVVSQLLPADQQVSANYLRDYFIAYQMHLPQQLTAGTYRMQLTMEDVNGKKYGQASIPFEIAK